MIGYDSKPIRDYCLGGLLDRVGSEREVKGEGVILPGIQGPSEGSPPIQKRGFRNTCKNVAAFCHLTAHKSDHGLYVVYTIMCDRGHVNDHLRPFSLLRQALIVVLQVN